MPSARAAVKRLPGSAHAAFCRQTASTDLDRTSDAALLASQSPLEQSPRQAPCWRFAPPPRGFAAPPTPRHIHPAARQGGCGSAVRPDTRKLEQSRPRAACCTQPATLRLSDDPHAQAACLGMAAGAAFSSLAGARRRRCRRPALPSCRLLVAAGLTSEPRSGEPLREARQRASAVPTPDEDKEVMHSAFMHAYEQASPPPLELHFVCTCSTPLWPQLCPSEP